MNIQQFSQYHWQLFKKVVTVLSLIALLVIPIFNTTMGIWAISNTPVVTVSEGTTGYSYRMQPRNGIDAWANGIGFELMTADGQVVFCLEPGVPTVNGRVYTSVELRDGEIIDARIKSTLTQAQIQKVKEIIFWGWDMSSDHSLHRYALVQSAIWRAIGWQFASLSGNGISIAQVEQLEREVDAHTTQTTSFNGETHSVKVGESMTLTDTNGNLQYLTFDNQNGWVFSHNGNSVTISPTVHAENIVAKSRNNKLNNQSKTGFILKSGGSQTLLAFKDPAFLETLINLNVIKHGHIRIHKTDSDTGANLSGVTFGLFEVGSTTPLQTQTTDDTGIVEFRDLEPKAFAIKEVQAKETYRLNEQVYSVTVLAGQTVTVNATNVAKKMYISLSKHLDDTLDGSGTRLVGANITFDIVSNTTNQVVQSVTTDDTGYAKSSALRVDDTYTIIEHAPNGYKASSPIVVRPTTEDNKVYHYVVENNVKKSLLQIVKVNDDTNEVIKASHVQFKLKRNGQYISQQVTYPNIKTIDVFETDENGQVTLPQALVYGDYDIEEIAAPKGYVLADKPMPITISGDTTVVTVHFKNKAQKGIIELSKTGQVLVNWQKDNNNVFTPLYEEQLLGNATFQFTHVATKDSFTLTTTQGQVLKTDELPLGTYEVVEIAAPNGYVKNDSVHRIVLSEQEQHIRLDVKTLAVHNKRQNIVVPVEKVFEQSDYFNHDQQATIGLFTAKDYVENGVTLAKDSLVGQVSVSKNGKATFNHLPVGMSLYVKELSTSQAYRVNETAFDVVVTPTSQKDSVSQTVIVNNALKRGNYEFVKVDASSQTVLAGATFKLVAVLDDHSEKIVGTYTSDSNGKVALHNLEYGRYYVKEEHAGDGYLLNHNTFYFDITGIINSSQSLLTIPNERMPLIETEATSVNGGKVVYAHELIKEVAKFDNLVPGKTYTTVVTMYNGQGKVLGTQERTFKASNISHREEFTFHVPVAHYGNTVFGEELYRDGEKVAIHFDLNNNKQTVKVLNPTIHTEATIGHKKTQFIGEKQTLVDTLTYRDFKQGKVLVKTWVVKYGTDEVVGQPMEQVLTLNGSGKVSVSLDSIDTSQLPAGQYTLMEQVFDVIEKEDNTIEKGNKIAEHVDNTDDKQSFTITPQLPQTGSTDMVGLVILGSVILGAAITLYRQKEND